MKALGLSLTTLLLVACSHSEFGKQHGHAVLENPTGIELEIRTRGDRQEFAKSETMFFEERYVSKYPGWHIEILDGWNEAAATRVFHLTDDKSIWKEQPITGIICCRSRHIWLGLDPVRLPYKLFANSEYGANPEWYALHLPTKPGKYRVYITTERVFGRGYATTTNMGKGVLITSDILKFEVK